MLNHNSLENLKSVSYWQAKAVSIYYLPYFLTLPTLTAYVTPSHPLLPNSLPCPLFITLQSLCDTHIAGASIGSVVQAHRDGKLVIATKLAERTLDRLGESAEAKSFPMHMNL